MKALIQRVHQASVEVQQEENGRRSSKTVGRIDEGLLILLGVDKDDNKEAAEKLAQRCVSYRVFSDQNGKMNLSVADKSAQLLVVSQFTLSADTRKGLRPSFTSAASPERAKELYEYFVQCCRNKVEIVETGIFAADMQVSLTNNGPVTFLLEV